jgi:alpha-glucosidase (family GH31 glycosyl hydrolase)
MAVFFRVGSVIPVFDSSRVASAQSTEDLVSDLEIKLRVVPGRHTDNLTCTGRLYIDDFHSHAYQQNSFVDINLTVQDRELQLELREGDSELLQKTKDKVKIIDLN